MAFRLAKHLNGISFKEISMGFLVCPANYINYQITRPHTKHWNPKWKRLRKMKVIKVELPDFENDPGKLSEEEVRSKMKEKGLLPPRPWVERPFNITCTGGIFEAYVPPEGDGKVSSITAQGAKQNVQFLEKKTKSMMAIRKVGSFDEDFNRSVFIEHAEDIYKKTHEFIALKDKYKIREYVTERAYPEVMHNLYNKTIIWKFIKNIERPRMVHARCTDIITKENVFAQITVRFHSQQILAVYDRFGRLMHGSDIIAKDVLEYMVFEKHLANEYGTWKIHAKIIPDWLPQKDPSPLTYKKPIETSVTVANEEKSTAESTETNISSPTLIEKPTNTSQTA
ncbi:probable 39S ribosomal protein L45, mitochondrial [Agrilus planipennis]|uniref:Large ribosomal subunit protein mL45 n=1 Tax=Agrilus planipennis TaxID=224129 RepID=A0A1W4X7Q7_AGRPL|nr:probable 39S ribosomal protein L45, mitochondrial [Agrilus planipennis]XP_018328437.1 probable 39S ribosomal protein L45, mitochondrial [Agrilus planipennis]XP_018328438.1 probable 39S ribosomal protein L45, mitochondrial [Agrilus planipennis]XP_018328439.1 probable 39S ribosomal protein L45, mitochondrial [Agrilus planipennis]XP_018328440.1 probable 39S ribosomal protein L45, mitochondrial [Agrilus planipennis]